ncbi:MAG: spondin domain-containing protein [Gammaproteobacteria bacterium]
MKLKLLAAFCGGLLLTGTALAGERHAQYKVTITNLTKAQAFTPILALSHRWGVHPFTVGEPASDALSALAEGGDVAPLSTMMSGNRKVVDIKHSEGLLKPGETTTIMLDAPSHARRISLASMLIPTNDSFIGLDNVVAPRKGKLTYWVPAFDAGTEPNDELCISIPGPVCSGEGGSPGSSGEGYVHISSGIHGIGDLEPATYDWRNPAAKVTIQRVR